MRQLTLMVTPEGRWVRPGTPEFTAALGGGDPGDAAEAQAVEALGFVRFLLVEQSIVEIELDPRKVQLPALLAAQQYLLASEARLFRLKYFETEWRSEISSAAEKTVARLVELCAPQFTPKGHDRFRVEPLDFAALLDDATHPMRPLAQKWRVSFGTFDPSIITLAMRGRLLQRLVIIGVRPGSDPVWRFIGDGHRWLGGRHYVHAGLGDKVTNIPDREYGEWAAQYYRLVADGGKPRFDLVTTAIQYQHEPDKPWRQVRYERLLLPWRTPSDEVFVTMCSKAIGGAVAAPPPAPALACAADAAGP